MKLNQYYTSTLESKLRIPLIQKKILRLTNVRKAAGRDDLSGHFLKDSTRVLSKPICELWNLPIKLGSFPDSCKIEKLKPLFKNESKTDSSNYKPMSLLPLISKIIEKLIHEQRGSFLSNNETLYNYQSGFRKNHSTDCMINL